MLLGSRRQVARSAVPEKARLRQAKRVQTEEIISFSLLLLVAVVSQGRTRFGRSISSTLGTINTWESRIACSRISLRRWSTTWTASSSRWLWSTTMKRLTPRDKILAARCSSEDASASVARRVIYCPRSWVSVNSTRALTARFTTT